MRKSENNKVKIEEFPESGKLQKRNHKFSEPYQAQNVEEMTGTEYDTGVGTVAIVNNISGDLEGLENQTNSMVVKISKKNQRKTII